MIFDCGKDIRNFKKRKEQTGFGLSLTYRSKRNLRISPSSQSLYYIINVIILHTQIGILGSPYSPSPVPLSIVNMSSDIRIISISGEIYSFFISNTFHYVYFWPFYIYARMQMSLFFYHVAKRLPPSRVPEELEPCFSRAVLYLPLYCSQLPRLTGDKSPRRD